MNTLLLRKMYFFKAVACHKKYGISVELQLFYGENCIPFMKRWKGVVAANPDICLLVAGVREIARA